MLRQIQSHIIKAITMNVLIGLLQGLFGFTGHPQDNVRGNLNAVAVAELHADRLTSAGALLDEHALVLGMVASPHVPAVAECRKPADPAVGKTVAAVGACLGARHLALRIYPSALPERNNHGRNGEGGSSRVALLYMYSYSNYTNRLSANAR